MKALLKFALVRHPRLYQLALSVARRSDAERLLLLRILQEGDVVFDVGANQGNYTILFSHIVGRTGSVHAFEPVPVTYASLQERVNQERRYGNVIFQAKGVGNREGQFDFYMPGQDNGQASMAHHEVGSWGICDNVTQYSCHVTTIDAYVESLAVKKLDFIKLDVEGAELLVLQGCSETVHLLRPMLYLEVYSEWMKDFGYTPADLLETLTALGYSRFYAVTDVVRPFWINTQAIDKVASLGSANLLCAGPEHAHRLRHLP